MITASTNLGELDRQPGPSEPVFPARAPRILFKAATKEDVNKWLDEAKIKARSMQPPRSAAPVPPADSRAIAQTDERQQVVRVEKEHEAEAAAQQACQDLTAKDQAREATEEQLRGLRQAAEQREKALQQAADTQEKQFRALLDAQHAALDTLRAELTKAQQQAEQLELSRQAESSAAACREEQMQRELQRLTAAHHEAEQEMAILEQTRRESAQRTQALETAVEEERMAAQSMERLHTADQKTIAELEQRINAQNDAQTNQQKTFQATLDQLKLELQATQQKLVAEREALQVHFAQNKTLEAAAQQARQDLTAKDQAREATEEQLRGLRQAAEQREKALQQAADTQEKQFRALLDAQHAALDTLRAELTKAQQQAEQLELSRHAESSVAACREEQMQCDLQRYAAADKQAAQLVAEAATQATRQKLMAKEQALKLAWDQHLDLLKEIELRK